MSGEEKWKKNKVKEGRGRKWVELVEMVKIENRTSERERETWVEPAKKRRWRAPENFKEKKRNCIGRDPIEICG